MKRNITTPIVKTLRLVAVFTMGLLFTTAQADDGLFPKKSRSLAFSHFTWGAEVGSSLDMTSHDLSTFDVDVMLGYKNSVLKIVGVGTGIHRSITTGNNFIPVYVMIRTGFTPKPSPFFLNIQAGYSFSRVGYSGTGGHAGSEGHSQTVGDLYVALGIGVMLKQTGMVRPFVALSAATQHFNPKHQSEVEIDSRYIYFAKLVIGVNF